MAKAEIISYGNESVRITPRPNGWWRITWRERGVKHETTATNHKHAIARARSIAKKLALKRDGHHRISEDEARLLDRCKLLAAGMNPPLLLPELISQIEVTLHRAGSWTVVEDAFRHWERTGKLTPVISVTMREAIDRFLDSYQDRAHETVRGVRKELKAFAATSLGELPCPEVTPDLLKEWIGRAAPSPPSARFFNNRLGTWRTFFRQMQVRGWQHYPAGEPNPAQSIDKRREAERAPAILTPALGWAARAHLLASDSTADLVWYWTLAGWAGLRPFELTRIRWEDLDWERGYITVRPEVARKTARERFVPMEAAVREMRHWLRPHRKGGSAGKVCGAKDRERASNALRTSGLLATWPQDVLRHSYITYRIARGDSIALIAEQAGNSERMIKIHYRRPVRPEEGQEWFQSSVKTP